MTEMQRYGVVLFDQQTRIPIWYPIDFFAESALQVMEFLDVFGIPYDDVMRFDEFYEHRPPGWVDPINN